MQTWIFLCVIYFSQKLRPKTDWVAVRYFVAKDRPRCSVNCVRAPFEQVKHSKTTGLKCEKTWWHLTGKRAIFAIKHRTALQLNVCVWVFLHYVAIIGFYSVILFPNSFFFSSIDFIVVFFVFFSLSLVVVIFKNDFAKRNSWKLTNSFGKVP